MRLLTHAVSQGSAAVSLRCIVIGSDYFVENSMLSLAVKEFENRLIFRDVIDTSRVSCFF